MGLTGDFGSGKTTTAQFFRQKGAHVLSADQLAHEVLEKKNRFYPKISLLFPELKGNLTRAGIAEIVFREPARRRKLECLVHPYVLERLKEKAQSTRKPVVVVEVPLLFESGFDRYSDINVVVKTPREKILKRLTQHGYSEQEIKARWRVQMPTREKIKRADYVIDNSKGAKSAQKQVAQVWEKIERSLATHGKRKRKQ